mgnify:CR=1 FL=1
MGVCASGLQAKGGLAGWPVTADGAAGKVTGRGTYVCMLFSALCASVGLFSWLVLVCVGWVGGWVVGEEGVGRGWYPILVWGVYISALSRGDRRGGKRTVAADCAGGQVWGAT